MGVGSATCYHRYDGGNWKTINDKRISLTYSQTLCYSRTWRTKVVCSSLMHTQTFTQTRRCRRTCKSACHRVRRLALPLSECSGAVLHSSTFVGHLHFCKKYAWVANPRIFLTCAVVEVGIFAFRSFGVFVHCTSCAMGYSYCYAVGSSICCCTPLTGVGESLLSRIWHSFSFSELRGYVCGTV